MGSPPPRAALFSTSDRMLLLLPGQMPGCRKAHWDDSGTLFAVKKDIRVVAGELQDDDGEGLLMPADILVHEIQSTARGDTEKYQFAGQRDRQQSLEAERALLRTVIDKCP